eukprot:gene20383-7391_t
MADEDWEREYKRDMARMERGEDIDLKGHRDGASQIRPSAPPASQMPASQ